MEIIAGSKKRHYFATVSVLLVTVILIAGISGCYSDHFLPPCGSQNLEISDWYDLDSIRDNLCGNHILMNDLDSTTAGYEELASPRANDGKGWDPIGWGYWVCGPPSIRLSGEIFKGSFDGQGHEIHDLCINCSSWGGMGLFGCVGKGGIIKNLSVINATVTVPEDVDALVRSNEGIGILDVAPDWAVGILVGINIGSVSDSYTSGAVSGDERVGGLVGENGGIVSNSYSTGNVTGDQCVGGLVGKNYDLPYIGSVSNCYATGNITGHEYVGGLVGRNSYDSGQGTVSNSFWDTQTSGLNTSDGGTGKNTTEMQDIITFSGATWNITTVGGIGERNITCIWNIVNGVTYPFLSWQFVKIRDWYDLDAVRDNLAGNHKLMNDLDSTTLGYEELASPTANGGKGWQPIGTAIDPFAFTGCFDGQGHEIRDLFINRHTEDAVGLFGAVAHLGVIKDVGVVNATVAGGHYYVGALAGAVVASTVDNSYSTGNVTGDQGVGGLVGVSEGTVTNSYSTGKVTGNLGVGGLVGANGYNNPGTVSNSYATGSVTGDQGVGGLVGGNVRGIVTDSYSMGNVTGVYNVGGLVGDNLIDGNVSDSYSTGSVTGNSSVGGLVGLNEEGTVSNSFWDTQTSGQATSDGGTGKNTTEMQDITTFSGAGWNITTVALNETNSSYIWNIVNNVTYPFLSWQP